MILSTMIDSYLKYSVFKSTIEHFEKFKRLQ